MYFSSPPRGEATNLLFQRLAACIHFKLSVEGRNVGGERVFEVSTPELTTVDMLPVYFIAELIPVEERMTKDE